MFDFDCVWSQVSLTFYHITRIFIYTVLKTTYDNVFLSIFIKKNEKGQFCVITPGLTFAVETKS